MIRYLIIVFALFLFGNTARSQNSPKLDDFGRIVLNTYLSEQIDIPAEARKLLETKLSQVASNYGIGGSSVNPRFVITASIDVGTKDIIAGPPQMIAQNIDVTLFIGDAIENTIYSSISIPLKGVGTNENKAFISALNRINSRNSAIKQFIEEGKDKIIQYYSSNCNIIYAKLEVLASQNKFDEAIFEANLVPSVCEECYNRIMEYSVEIFKMKMNNECAKNIAKSNSFIAQDDYENAAKYLSGILPDVSCYEEAQILLNKIIDHRCADAIAKARGAWASGNYRLAGDWLGKIPSDSKCSGDAIALGEEIKAKLKADEDREWEYKLQKQRDETNIESQRINAIKEIGVAFGNNQPKTINYNNIYWR